MSTKSKEQQLSQKQKLAILLISTGLSQKDAAELVGVHPQQVSRWKQQEAFKEHLALKMKEIQGEVEKAKDILVEAATLAAMRAIGCLGSDDEAIALRAADAILDRVGIARAKNVDLTSAGEKLPSAVIYLPKIDDVETE